MEMSEKKKDGKDGRDSIQGFFFCHTDFGLDKSPSKIKN